MSETNIYGIDWRKYYKDPSELCQSRRKEWTAQGRCYLCGGDHSKDIPRSVVLVCPFCGEKVGFEVMPHCPGGVSHGETHSCKKCHKEVFLVVYYDGMVIIQRSGKS